MIKAPPILRMKKTGTPACTATWNRVSGYHLSDSGYLHAPQSPQQPSKPKLQARLPSESRGKFFTFLLPGIVICGTGVGWVTLHESQYWKNNSIVILITRYLLGHWCCWWVQGKKEWVDILFYIRMERMVMPTATSAAENYVPSILEAFALHFDWILWSNVLRASQSLIMSILQHSVTKSVSANLVKAKVRSSTSFLNVNHDEIVLEWGIANIIHTYTIY